MPTTSATGYDICARAAKYVGILAAGEVLAAEDAADALEILNGMLDAWNSDRTYVYASTFNTFALASGTQSYTIGPTGTFAATVRPSKIEEANLVITSQTPNVRRPLFVGTDQDWMAVRIRPLSTPSIPTLLYYSRDVGNGTIYVWPTPTSGLSVELELWTVIPQFAALTDSFNLPPGFFECVTQNLALRLCSPEFGIDAPPPSIVDMARESRMRIASLNADPPPYMSIDSGLQGVRQNTGNPLFNIKAPMQWYR